MVEEVGKCVLTVSIAGSHCCFSVIQCLPVRVQEERKKRLGPGGLDPLEVMETLPPVSETLSLSSIHLLCHETLFYNQCDMPFVVYSNWGVPR